MAEEENAARRTIADLARKHGVGSRGERDGDGSDAGGQRSDGGSDRRSTRKRARSNERDDLGQSTNAVSESNKDERTDNGGSGEPGVTVVEIDEPGGTGGGESNGGIFGGIFGGRSGNSDNDSQRRTTEGRKTRKKTAQQARPASSVQVDDEAEDVKNLVKGIGAGFSNWTHFSPFEISDEEAYTIAVPAARIMARHGFTETVRKYSDPFILLTAIGTVFGPRVIMYRNALSMAQQQIDSGNATSQPRANETSAPPPTQSSGKTSSGTTKPTTISGGNTVEALRYLRYD